MQLIDFSSLSPEERSLIIFLRTLVDCEVVSYIKDSKPVLSKLFYSSFFLDTIPANGGELTTSEQGLIKTIRDMKFGQLHCRIVDGALETIFTDSFLTVRHTDKLPLDKVEEV